MIEVTKNNYWQELKDNKSLSDTVRNLLIELINSLLHHTIHPIAATNVIRFIRECPAVLEGISIDYADSFAPDTRDVRWYDIMMYVPNDRDFGRAFLLLIKKYPNGRLTYLKDLPNYF